MNLIHMITGSPHSGEWIYSRPQGGLTGPEGVAVRRHSRPNRVWAVILADLGPVNGGIYR